MNKQPKDEIIKQEIISTALALFCRYGLMKTTMEDIAKAAGKGKSTLYHYFKSKEDVFDAVCNQQMKSIFAEVGAAVEKSPTASQKIKTYFEKYISIASLKSNTLLTDVLRIDLKENGNSIIGRAKKQFDNSENQFFKEILVFGVKTGEFPRISEEEIDAISTVFSKSIRNLIIDMIIDENDKIDKALNAILNILVKGLQAR